MAEVDFFFVALADALVPDFFFVEAGFVFFEVFFGAGDFFAAAVFFVTREDVFFFAAAEVEALDRAPEEARFAAVFFFAARAFDDERAAEDLLLTEVAFCFCFVEVFFFLTGADRLDVFFLAGRETVVFFRFTALFAVFLLEGAERGEEDLARTTAFFVFEEEGFFFTAADFLRGDALVVFFVRDF